MVARLVLSSEIIEVKNPPVLLYGQPGVSKTSLGQTAKNPLTLDFDKGIHRSAFRKASLYFETWDEVVQVQQNGVVDNGTIVMAKNFGSYDTIVVDTIGTMLTAMTQAIIANNSKMGTKTGGLTMQGWGALGTLFENWLTGLRQMGKQVIMIAHQKEEKEGDGRVMRPDISGRSYAIVMNCADVVGYVSYRNGVRSISWEPTDDYFAKNGARLISGPIPDFNAVPDYMDRLLTQAKANLGSTAESSAKLAGEVEKWEARLEPGDCDVTKINEVLTDFKKMTGASQTLKTQVWSLMKNTADKLNLTFNKEAARFEEKASAA